MDGHRHDTEMGRELALGMSMASALALAQAQAQAQAQHRRRGISLIAEHGHGHCAPHLLSLCGMSNDPLFGRGGSTLFPDLMHQGLPLRG